MTSIPMDATSEPADANAARLRQLIRANEPAAPLTALAILLLYLLLYRAPILIVLEVGLLFTVVAQRFASHSANQSNCGGHYRVGDWGLVSDSDNGHLCTAALASHRRLLHSGRGDCAAIRYR